MRGVAVSLSASCLFGLVFYLTDQVGTSPEVATAWRVLLTSGSGIALLSLRPTRQLVKQLWTAVTATWWMPLVLLALSAGIGAQLWLFTWAPVHGYALDVSLGYLLLPISLVLTGRFVFHDSVTRVQWIAVGVAATAVALRITATHAISWVTLTICLGYPAYLAVRKYFRLDNAAVFAAECTVLSPAALIAIASGPGPSTTQGVLAISAMALAGTAGMYAFLAAARLLSMPAFGLLSYAEPVLLFFVALTLGERITGPDIVVYSLLSLALLLLAVQSLLSVRDIRTAQRLRGAAIHPRRTQPSETAPCELGR
ncbi:EamA family transporter [Streptomyces sp. NPDC002680]|uniref:EamA family transporter n=1 Tax=Streptomyces sp. NPDC002680 TaxID=3364659 RepID=UPI0036B91589